MAKIYLGKENTAIAISNLISGAKSLLSKMHICKEGTLTDIKTSIGSDADVASSSGTIFSKLKYISENMSTSSGSSVPRSPKRIELLTSTGEEVSGKGRYFGTCRGDRLDGGFYVDGTRMYIEHYSSIYEDEYIYFEGEFNNSIRLVYSLNSSSYYGSIIAVVYEEA